MVSGLDHAAAREIGWHFLERQAALVLLRVDGEGDILFANDYARELTGLPLVSGSLRDLLIATARQTDLQHWLAPSDEPRLMNVRTSDGLSQSLYVSTFPLGSERLLLGQADPREQERLRREFLELNHELTALGRELALANAELVRLNGLKNKFLGMASHDLRKPTGLILNRAELLLEDATVSVSAEARVHLHQIIASAGSMACLIDDFLELSSIEADRLSLDIQVVLQDQLVAAALALVQEAADRRAIELRVSLDPAGARLRVDGPKLEQVLTNLLSNAIEFSPDGCRVSLASELEGEGIRFWVEDQGPGLNPEEQQRLFAPFSGSGGLKPSGERSIGLGLAIVRKIVEAHGGSCFVESQKGEGARFGFRLPAGCRAMSAPPLVRGGNASG
jgi:signal transduction histidine kinase